MDFGIFELLAELSIGLLGFTGVVSALGRSRLTAEVRAFRVGALVSYSSTSLLGSILPFWPHSIQVQLKLSILSNSEKI